MRRTAVLSRRPALFVVAGALLLSGCGAPDVDRADAGPPPFADCSSLTAPRANAAVAVSPGPAPPALPEPALAEPAPPGLAEPLPDLSLPCFTGGAPVRLQELNGPIVINVWQSACAPCREELPAFQRLADRHAGRLHVLGVVSRDSRAAARSFGEDLRISFPNVEDRDGRFQAAFGRNLLPLTVLADASGSVRNVYNSSALDDAGLDRLVRSHLGIG